MCGRTEQNVAASELRELLGLERFPMVIEAKFNVAPSYATADKWLVRVSPQDGRREMVPARWWLIPAWWDKPLAKLPTSFNARAEDVAAKPMFREAFKSRRCLVPATGWYEFQGQPGKKRAFHFGMPGGKPFAFAGIYDEWTEPGTGEVITSFAIITTEPSQQAAEVHDRMPLVIAPQDYATWLDAKDPDGAALMKPWSRELEVYRSSGVGNDPRVEGPDVAAPWVEGKDRQGSLF